MMVVMHNHMVTIIKAIKMVVLEVIKNLRNVTIGDELAFQTKEIVTVVDLEVKKVDSFPLIHFLIIFLYPSIL